MHRFISSVFVEWIRTNHRMSNCKRKQEMRYARTFNLKNVLKKLKTFLFNLPLFNLYAYFL